MLRRSTTATVRIGLACTRCIATQLGPSSSPYGSAPLAHCPSPVVAKATRGMDIARLACTMLTECSWEAQCAR